MRKRQKKQLEMIAKIIEIIADPQPTIEQMNTIGRAMDDIILALRGKDSQAEGSSSPASEEQGDGN